MWQLTKTALLASRRRLVATSLAVCLGVAFLTGTLVLGDTLAANFDRLFTTAYGKTDVVVRSSRSLSTEVETAQTLIDGSVADRIRTCLLYTSPSPRDS